MMKCIVDKDTIVQDCSDYLRDESRVAAPVADAVAWPENEDDVREALARARAHGWPVTVSAARTGIVAAAVPSCGGMVLSVERMGAITDVGFDAKAGSWFLVAQPGVLVSTIQEALDSSFAKHGETLSAEARVRVADAKQKGVHLFYPPDPTEMSAMLGGTVATNASGARTFKYGATRAWVRRIHVVLADGTVLNIPRGLCFAGSENKCVVPKECFLTEPEHGFVVPIPAYRMPDTKHCAGYFAAPDMDLIDLFIGSEGTLGVITEVEIGLCVRDKERLSIMAFFDVEQDALRFVRIVREAIAARTLDIEAIEYFGATALELLRNRRSQGDQAIPEIPAATAALYLELAFTPDAMDATLELLDQHLQCCNSSTERAWAGTEDAEIVKMKAIRHAVPETINQTIGERKRAMPALHKIATDLAVPDSQLDAIMRFYHESLDHAGLQFVVFGHIGNNHLHVNIMPRTEAELAAAKVLYRTFAEKAIELGGTVAAEHGIGRLKKEFLKMMYGEQGIAEMRAVKRALDPTNMLAPGVLFD